MKRYMSNLGPNVEVIPVLNGLGPKSTTVPLDPTRMHLGPHAEVVAVLDDAAGHGQPRPPPRRLVVPLRRVDDARQGLQGAGARVLSDTVILIWGLWAC